MSRVLVNVQVYGDFDMPYTEVIMEAPGFVDPNAVAGIIKLVKEENSKTDDVGAVISQLKSLGFSVCKTVDLTIGGDL